MSAPIVFLDTETTGLSLTDDIWEFAAIYREPSGDEYRLHLFIEHDPVKAAALPESFRADLARRFDPAKAYTQKNAALLIHDFLDLKPHIVGACPNFDTERLAILLRRHGFEPAWHYHLIDVENLAVGYLAAIGKPLSPPWDSNELSAAIGVDPEHFSRHEAMADAEWARAIYDRVMGLA